MYLLHHVFPAVDDTTAACLFWQDSQSEERDQDAGDQKTDAVDRIRDSNCFQAAEDSCSTADNTNDVRKDLLLVRIWSQPGSCRRYQKDPLENDRAGIQDDGEVQDEIHDNDDRRENKLVDLPETLLHRARGIVVVPIFR